MRITDGTRQNQVLRSLSDATARQAEATSRALTGRRVNTPSSDPTAAAELARNRVSQARNQANKDALGSARGDLELAEGVLAEAGDLFQRASEIAIQGGDGALDAAGRASLAQEVSHLKTQLVSIANARGSKGALFAGSRLDTPPFSTSGAFSGDDVLQVADLGTGAPVTVGVSGERAFTASGGRDVFADLDALESALASNDSAAVTATLGNLESSRQQLMAVQADAGLRLARLDTTEAVVDRKVLALAKRDEVVGGADPYAAYSDLVTLGQALEQAVAVSKKVLDLGDLFRF